ncbi:DNA topoisomerase [Eubacteriaceae bacterium ES3]|nr:DNA topoisomerase [Eubacteriaceae bacterium ES3]
MILIVAEKKSFAEVLAEVLKVKKSKGQYWQNDKYYISWCYGHLVELKNPDDYDPALKNWSYETLPIIPGTIQHKVRTKPDIAKSQFNTLKKLMNGNDIEYVICATDADREGELIYRRIHNMAGCKKPVKRLWCDSMENQEVEKALGNLKPDQDYDHLHEASHCRAVADWLIGMNGTRLFSTLHRNKLTVGRVQTPTLAMIVERDLQIENFVKQTYYTVHLQCGGLDGEGERIDDVNEAKRIQAVTHLQDAKILSVEKNIKNNNPPKLYSLSDLQGDANQYYGYTAQETLDIVQKLYEKKLMTYPRTSSQYITSEMRDSTLDVVPMAKAYCKFLGGISQEKINIDKVVDDKKVESHTALIPTREIGKSQNLSNLPMNEQHILTLVCVRLICAVDSPQQYSETIVVIESSGERDYPFKAKGKVIIEPGWKRLLDEYQGTLKSGKEEKDKDHVLPDVEEGQVYKGESQIADHLTSPPKRYTDKTLLDAMKRAGKEFIEEDTSHIGIGTEATRAGVRENDCGAGFERKP